MSLPIGFSTAPFVHHPPAVAIAKIRELGFDCVMIGLDAKALNPFDAIVFHEQIARVEQAVGDMPLLVDTDAPFLLDSDHPRRPHLCDLDEKSARWRMDLIEKGIQVAGRLGAKDVLFSIGSFCEEESIERILEVTAPRITQLLGVASSIGVRLAVRPETGGLLGSVSDFDRLQQWLEMSDSLFLAGDVTVMSQLGEMPAVPLLSRYRDRLVCVNLTANTGVDGQRLCRELQCQKMEVPLIIQTGGGADVLALARDALQNIDGR